MWAPKPVWTLRRRRNLTPAGNRSPAVKSRSLSLIPALLLYSRWWIFWRRQTVRYALVTVSNYSTCMGFHVIWNNRKVRKRHFPLNCITCVHHIPSAQHFCTWYCSYVLLSERLITYEYNDIMSAYEGVPRARCNHFATSVTLQWRHNENPFSHESQHAIVRLKD
jgi:hypothetical protein